jgi:hypothetical protein
MITLFCNILMYFIMKSLFCECLWHNPNYSACDFHLLFILFTLLHYLQQYQLSTHLYQGHKSFFLYPTFMKVT